MATAGWMLHYLLRVMLAVQLLAYGWSKVFLIQMGTLDFQDLLVQYGEMSPMGLLWRFMQYSPPVQILAGAAEVAAAALLLLRRTAGLGALLGLIDMAIVFGLNLAFDVPVKQLSLAMALGCLLVLTPYLPRYVRLAGNGAVPPGPLPRAIPWPAVARVTAWLGPILAVGLVAGSGVAVGRWMGATTVGESPLAGVYRVTTDSRPPAAQLGQDTRWQQVSLAARTTERGAGIGVRQVDGTLRFGRYRITGPDTIAVTLGAPVAGDRRIDTGDDATPRTYAWARTPEGGLRLTGDGQSVTLTSDAEARFLLDRDFSWAPRMPLNR